VHTVVIILSFFIVLEAFVVWWLIASDKSARELDDSCDSVVCENYSPDFIIRNLIVTPTENRHLNVGDMLVRQFSISGEMINVSNLVIHSVRIVLEYENYVQRHPTQIAAIIGYEKRKFNEFCYLSPQGDDSAKSNLKYLDMIPWTLRVSYRIGSSEQYTVLFQNVRDTDSQWRVIELWDCTRPNS